MDEKEIKNPKMKVILGSKDSKKKQDKLNAMRIALTYIEGQGMVKVTPKKVIGIADEFLKWIEK